PPASPETSALSLHDALPIFVLAGGGDRLEELRAAAARFAERVHFPGAVMHDSLPDLYRGADLFVLPAVHDARGNVDGLPNVILRSEEHTSELQSRENLVCRL